MRSRGKTGEIVRLSPGWILTGVQANIKQPRALCDMLTPARGAFSPITNYFFPFLSFAAFTNPTNKGCGLMGRDKNSGWN